MKKLLFIIGVSVAFLALASCSNLEQRQELSNEVIEGNLTNQDAIKEPTEIFADENKNAIISNELENGVTTVEVSSSEMVTETGTESMKNDSTLKESPLNVDIDINLNEPNSYVILHDGIIYTVTISKDTNYNFTLTLLDSESKELQSLALESQIIVGIKFMDVNLDGYTDIVLNTGGTWNETHELYIWNFSSQNYTKVIFQEFDMLADFQVCEGYIENFIRGDGPDDSFIEKLVWHGNVLTKEGEVVYKTGN
ncbi:hypothetical protein [Lacrimispora brassicae]